jgi:hypothetical protein
MENNYLVRGHRSQVTGHRSLYAFTFLPYRIYVDTILNYTLSTHSQK